jgi:non-ribosomal peptide synthetase component E (peptide arylation enzyme)
LCARELARYKRPKQFLVIEERDLPLTITGKVRKDDLIRRFT